MRSRELLVAGGGIGGLAAALGARRAGWGVRVLEQAAGFSEVGAGIQLGPNSTRILREWNLLERRLADKLAQPARLVVRDAQDGTELGTLCLHDFEARYGAPYLTVHRADLQAALLRQAGAEGAQLETGRRVESAAEQDEVLRVSASNGPDSRADALVGADGLWSGVRALVLADVPPRFTGQLAYRALLKQSDLPAAARSEEVTAWLGPRMHLVTYPVRACEYLNVVCVVEGAMPRGDAHSWDHEGVRARLLASLGPVCVEARERIESVSAWRLWPLHGRAPVAGAHQMAAGRVALVGDAAHPMLPFLAQGAGMAIEDARELQRELALVAGTANGVPAALHRYAMARWLRCARVQERSLRNATIFHARGPLRFARNAAVRFLGERLLDVPWLYTH